jgi:hypothetical protein
VEFVVYSLGSKLEGQVIARVTGADGIVALENLVEFDRM